MGVNYQTFASLMPLTRIFDLARASLCRADEQPVIQSGVTYETKTQTVLTLFKRPMANNTLPTNSAQLIGLAQKMHTGIVQLGVEIPIVMVTAAQVQTDLDAFIAVDVNFNAARSTRLAVSEVFQGKMESLYAWLLGVSNVLATRFGTRWSTAWAQAGFVNHSTGIPTKMEEQLGLALSLVKFFTANPTFEVPSMKLTAAEGTILWNAALTAQGTLTTATVALSTIGDAWQTAYEKLVGLMRELIKNLEGKLKNHDPRWLAFGLNLPAASVAPGQPVQVTAQADESGAIVVQCEPVALATRYRWRTRLVGGQAEYQRAAGTVAPLAVLGNVAAGQTVEIIVQAVNGGRQGVASEPILFTLPPAKTAGFTNLAASEEVPVAEGAHGHRNGNGRPVRVG